MHLKHAVLLVSLSVATSISFFSTVSRVLFNTREMTYDSWIFGMCFALTLQVYDALSLPS